ncbi:MAG: MucR family transcriptional regulator [Deltaproteobacteria bacterium]|nr:MucR family transcriptional regulator [Deltaproteobacteria bacterium]MBW2068226.1 MucR family transcriptional regulator [Deltaproteobacteria bacterium]
MLDKEIVQSIIHLVGQRRDIDQAVEDFKKMYAVVSEIMGEEVSLQEEKNELEELRKRPMESIGKEAVVCLECGEKLSSLAPHLRRKHQMSAREYKKKWGMKLSTKLVSENYRKKRQKMAQDIDMTERVQKMLEAKRRKAEEAKKSS